MDKKDFSVGNILSVCWQKVNKNLGFLIGLMFIMMGLSFAISLASNIIMIIPILGWIAGTVGSIALNTYFGIGQTYILLDVNDAEEGAKFDYKKLFDKKNWGQVVNVFVVQLLVGLIVLGGFLLLIVPGIIWALKYSQASILVIDKKMDPLAAIKKSGEITKGYKGNIFVLGLALVGINILGALCLVVGLLWTMPLSMLAGVYVYRMLSKQVQQAETTT